MTREDFTIIIINFTQHLGESDNVLDQIASGQHKFSKVRPKFE